MRGASGGAHLFAQWRSWSDSRLRAALRNRVRYGSVDCGCRRARSRSHLVATFSGRLFTWPPRHRRPFKGTSPRKRLIVSGRARERPAQTSTASPTVSLPASLRATRRGHLLEVREASFLKPDSSPRAAATSTPGRQIGIGRWRKRLGVGPIDVLAAGLCVVLGTRPPPADHLVRDRV